MELKAGNSPPLRRLSPQTSYLRLGEGPRAAEVQLNPNAFVNREEVVG